MGEPGQFLCETRRVSAPPALPLSGACGLCVFWQLGVLSCPDLWNAGLFSLLVVALGERGHLLP